MQTSVNNYEYLDILDDAWPEGHAWSVTAPRAAQGMELLCDVGCASFWYAAALEAFFRPERVVGVDVEGHRLFKDGRTRIDYAAGYCGAAADRPLRGRGLPRTTGSPPTSSPPGFPS